MNNLSNYNKNEHRKNYRNYKKTYKKMKRVRRDLDSGKGDFPVRTLIFICVVAAALTVLSIMVKVSTRFKEMEPVIDTDTTALISDEGHIPYVEMITKAGKGYNRLTGIRSDTFVKDEAADTYSVMPPERELKFRISEPVDSIKNLSYQVRDMSDGTLIEDAMVDSGSMKESKSMPGQTEVSIRLKDLLAPMQDYNVQLLLETESMPAFIYNTRVDGEDDALLDKKIDIVAKFTENVFDSTAEEIIAEMIKPANIADTANYALATYKSPTALVMWSGLGAKKLADPVVSLMYSDEETAVLTQSYPVVLEGSDEPKRYLTVNEAFYVAADEEDEGEILNYERKAYERLQPSVLCVNDGDISLGYQADSDISIAAAPSGGYVCFVNGNNLWLLQKGAEDEKSRFARIYSFDRGEDTNSDDKESDYAKYESGLVIASETGGIENLKEGFGIHVISVSDEGNVKFAVYGTFPSGKRIGEKGISFFEYRAPEQTLTEIIFMEPDGKTYDELADIAKQSYMNRFGELFITADENIIKLDITDYSTQSVTKDAISDEYVRSDDNSRVAFYTKAGQDEELGSEIQIYSLGSGKKTNLSSKDGKDMQMIGFAGEDFVYGLADSTMQTEERDTIYLDEIIICTDDGTEVRRYSQDGVRFAGVHIEGLTVTFSCFKTGKEDGRTVYIDAGTNSLVGRDETRANDYSLRFKSTGLSRNELWIEFFEKAGESDAADTTDIREYDFVQENVITPDGKLKSEG